MAIRTALTEAFGLEYPIVLAPMGQVAGRSGRATRGGRLQRRRSRLGRRRLR